MPVSGDDKLNARLLDPEVNAHFISMDPGVSALLSNLVILSEMEKTISNMMGLTQDVAPFELASMDSSAPSRIGSVSSVGPTRARWSPRSGPATSSTWRSARSTSAAPAARTP